MHQSRHKPGRRVTLHYTSIQTFGPSAHQAETSGYRRTLSRIQTSTKFVHYSFRTDAFNFVQ